MRGHVLFISKEERTVDEAWKSLERFCIGSYIPETFYADLDNPDIAEAFDDAREKFNRKWDVDRIEELREELQKAKENGEKWDIEYLQNNIDELEAFNNGDLSVLNDEELALKNGNLKEWIENIEDFTISEGKTYLIKIYKIRDGKIYTTKNFKNGFWDGIFDELGCLLTDKNGNEVESCICKDIDFSKLSNNVTAIAWEDSDDYLDFGDYAFTDNGKEFEKKFNEALNSIPPDSYIRILQYHTSI